MKVVKFTGGNYGVVNYKGEFYDSAGNNWGVFPDVSARWCKMEESQAKALAARLDITVLEELWKLN